MGVLVIKVPLQLKIPKYDVTSKTMKSLNPNPTVKSLKTLRTPEVVDNNPVFFLILQARKGIEGFELSGGLLEVAGVSCLGFLMTKILLLG